MCRSNSTVVLFFAGIFLVLVLVFFDVQGDLHMYGEFVRAPRTTATLRGVLDGSWQSAYGAWFKENYPCRDYVIRTYDQFKYSVLGQSPNRFVTLVDGAVVEIAYIDQTLRLDVVDPQPALAERIERYADDLLTIQTELEKQGKKFLYVITPSKDYLYADRLPLRYAWNDNTDVNPNNWTLLVRAFDRRGVRYYDAHAAVDRVLAEGRYPPFSTTGTHWNTYLSAFAAQGLVDALDAAYGVDLPRPVVRNVQRVAQPQGQDRDLLDLLNLWFGRLDPEYLSVEIGYDLPAGAVATKLLYFGTSFQRQLLGSLEAPGAYRADDAFQYFQKRNGAGEYPLLEGGIEEIDLAALVTRNDLFLMENVSSYMPQADIDFAAALARYLKTGVQSYKEVSGGDGPIDLLLRSSAALHAHPGDALTVPLTVVNRTTNVTLSSTYRFPFRLSYHLLAEDGTVVLREGNRTPIARDIPPSASLETGLEVVAPTAPGHYVLQVTFVQEGRLWGEAYEEKLPVEIDLFVE